MSEDLHYAALLQVARDFSPRVETHGDRTIALDISGLGRLIGEPRTIGEELRRATADAGLRVHVAVAATLTAAVLLAYGRAGLTVVPPGGEAAALAPLPLRVLTQLEPGTPSDAPRPKPEAGSLTAELDQLTRWGVRTLGDLAALPSAELTARLGQPGVRWQRWAVGDDMRPMVRAAVAERFEESLDLEWPIDALEPLSFVLARLLDPLCERLEQRDRGAVVLRMTLTLVTSEGRRGVHERVVELPAPMRDARVLRTLALLDLESNPPPAAVDRIAVAVDVAEGRVLQFGLFARALPADTLATLMARLGALMGADRIGAPALLDTYRPGAFAMAPFSPQSRLCASDAQALRRGSPKPSAEAAPTPDPQSTARASVLRRFRTSIPARVVLEQGRPARVTTDRRGISGGRVTRCDGPWRSSGDWWKNGWNSDEWDVVCDGATYRISQAHDTGGWFVDGLVD